MLTLSVVDADAPASVEVTEAVRRALHDVEEATGHPPLADPKLHVLHGHGVGVVVVAVDNDAPRDGGNGGDAVAGVGVGVLTDPGAAVWNLGDAVRNAADRLAVVRATADAARERGARRLQWWAFQAGGDDDALAAELGWSAWRDLVQVRRPLPHPEAAELPPGIELRPFASGTDDESWLEVNRLAFAGHPEQQVFSAADLRGRIAEPWFDASDFLIAEDDAGIAGFCWVKIPAPSHGEIYVVGVHPRAQGLGLGRSLVLAGLDRMTTRGVPEVRLYVDGENERAVALYRALGFQRHHVDRAYATDV